jgi:signal transduction histidine kinase
MKPRSPFNFWGRLLKRIIAILKHAGAEGSGTLARPALWLVVIVCSSLVLLDGILDFSTGPYISFSIFYLLPVALATWLVSRRLGFIFATGSALVGFICDVALNSHWRAIIPCCNGILRFGVFSIVVILLSALRRQTRQLSNAVAVRTERLIKEIAERKRVEREVFKILQQQKQEMAHELHDGLAQSLTAIAMNTKHLEEELQAVFSPQAEAALRIVRRLNEAVGQTRQIARGLSPTTVGANELISAVTEFALETENTFGITCRVKTNVTRLPLGADVGLHLYRIVQQAIDNAIRHGKATTIEIAIEVRNSKYHLAIRDNGTGFANTLNSHCGLGLKTMQFRAELLSGVLRISSQPGEGACVEVAGRLVDVEQVVGRGESEADRAPAPV